MYKKIDTTISFYKFINITNLDAVKSKIYRYLDNHNIYVKVII
jgi:predicted sulfurtransferase